MLELAVPAWHSRITLTQTADMERVQRVALSVILSDVNTGKYDFNYDRALVILGLEPLTLKDRRISLSNNFFGEF